MTPARSLAASVVALGFAGALTAPQPALAAPAPCEQAESFAGQSGAELLRIHQLEVRTSTMNRPRVKQENGVADAAHRVLSSGDDSIVPDPADSDTPSEAIGLIGTGVLGYLGVLPKSAAPKSAPKTSGNADVAPGGGDGSAGGGGGEPVDEEQSAEGGEGRSTDTGRAGANGDDSGNEGEAAATTTPDRRAPGRDVRTDTASLADVGLGEARTAMIANARIASAAYARMLDGYPKVKASATHAAMVKPLMQQAPPTNADASRRSTPAGKAGPLQLGDGRMGTHARWDTGMACGRVAGETGRAEASLNGVSLLGTGREALVRVPETMTGRSSTALDHRGDEPRTVARSTVTAGRIELAGGQVHLRVLQAPVLEAAMSADSGGQVSYRPAVVEISGDGIETKRLTTAGEHVDVSLSPRYREMESMSLRSLTGLGDLRKAQPMPMPEVPGLPSVTTPETESVPAGGDGINLRVALGDVRHAIQGQAIAARASAVKISLSQATASKGDGYGAGSEVSLTMSLGVLEAAAVSPEAGEISSSGEGGGLPVTGSNVTRVALIGGVLLLVGAAAVVLTRRRRRFRS
ncbi:LPXTG cell wall anchor domain-containing protein [Paractinoplanes maris]|uniref:LPXTG cell wall anchor domain-containing protein n=1 Tax=Paractinoplanes maris TaxID=1734446 RepID=UPI00202134C3|nr:LPXTG cell wall anchor domain-containing protein [Actinoplanes maris]